MCEPTVGGTAEVIEVLRARGACFATELGTATGRLPEDVERALWDGVARGILTADGFGAIRARRQRARTCSTTVVSRAAAGDAHPARGRRQVVARAPCRAPTSTVTSCPKRWPIYCCNGGASCSATSRDARSIKYPWRDIQRALRRLEDRGLVQGGRFVSGFSGEQYALPAAAEQLAHVRKLERTGERVTVNATDPCNFAGSLLPGAVVPTVRTNRVTYVDGVPVV